DDTSVDALSPEKLHHNLVREMHDMRGRHYLPIRRDQHTRSDLAEPGQFAVRRDLPFTGANDHDRWTHRLEDLGQILSTRGRRGSSDPRERHKLTQRAPHTRPRHTATAKIVSLSDLALVVPCLSRLRRHATGRRGV